MNSGKATKSCIWIIVCSKTPQLIGDILGHVQAWCLVVFTEKIYQLCTTEQITSWKKMEIINITSTQAKVAQRLPGDLPTDGYGNDIKSALITVGAEFPCGSALQPPL